MSNAYRSGLGAQTVLPTGDAVEANVLSGKTFSNAQGTGKTGTMTNRGAVTQTLNYGQEYTIQEGYHNGSGKVTAPSKGSVNLSTPLYQSTGTNVTYNHTNSSTEAILFTAGGTGTPTVTGSSGVTVAEIGHPTLGYITPYWYKITGLTNGSTVNVSWTGGGPSIAVMASSGVNYT